MDLMKCDFKVYIIFFLIFSFDCFSQGLKDEKIIEIKLLIENQDIVSFDKVVFKAYKKNEEAFYESQFDNKSILQYLIDSGFPEFVDLMIEKGYDFSRDGYQSREEAVERALMIKQFKPILEEYLTNLRTNFIYDENQVNQPFARITKRNEILKKIQSERQKQYIDSLWLLGYYELLSEMKSSHAFVWITRLDKGKWLNVEMNFFDSLFYLNAIPIFNDLIAGEINKIENISNDLSGLSMINKYKFWKGDLYNGIQIVTDDYYSKSLPIDEYFKYTKKFDEKKCSIINSNKELETLFENGSNDDINKVIKLFCIDVYGETDCVSIFEKCEYFTNIRNRLKCNFYQLLANEINQEHPSIVHPDFNFFSDKQLSDFIISSDNEYMEEILFGNFNSIKKNKIAFYIYLEEKSKICGSRSNVDYIEYKTRYDRVYSSDGRVTDVYEGNTNIYYIEPKYLSFFKSEEGPGTATFSKQVFSSLIELVGWSSNDGISGLRRFVKSFLEKYGCESNQVRQLEMNLYLMSYDKPSLQELFENESCD